MLDPLEVNQVLAASVQGRDGKERTHPGVRQNSNFQILGCLKENWPSIMRPPLIMQTKFSFIF
jgi:hypothetical protein